MHHLFLKYSLIISYRVLSNYIVHRKLELNLELQGFPCIFKSTVDIRVS
jgi:hypothetical protein